MHPESQSKQYVLTSTGEKVDVSYFVQSSPAEKKNLKAHFAPELLAESAGASAGTRALAPAPITTPRGSRGLYPPQVVQTAVASTRQMNQGELAGRGHTVF
jgi:hypothetical protein